MVGLTVLDSVSAYLNDSVLICVWKKHKTQPTSQIFGCERKKEEKKEISILPNDIF